MEETVQKKDILISIKDYFKDVLFDEGKHSYRYKDIDAITSVSGIIKKFATPFDTDKMAKYCAVKRNTDENSLKKSWKQISQEACKQGTETHSFAESYFIDKNLLPINSFQEAVVSFYKDLPDYIEPAISELRMFHKELHFAGTCDLLLYNHKKRSWIIADYKTNSDLFKNYKSQMLLEPFNDLLDNPFNQYQLQLCLYQILLQQLNIPVDRRKIIWLLPNGDYNMYDTLDYTIPLKIELDKMFYGKK